MARFLQDVRSLALLLARVGLGAILVLHGWTRWQAPGQGVAHQVAYLNQFAVPHAQIVAWGSIVFELVGGIFMIAGAATFLVGLGVLVEQVLTIAWTNWYKRSPLLLNPDGSYNGGYEYNVALGLLGLLFFVYGGGAVGVDRLFRRRETAPAGEPDSAPVRQGAPLRHSGARAI